MNDKGAYIMVLTCIYVVHNCTLNQILKYFAGVWILYGYNIEENLVDTVPHKKMYARGLYDIIYTFTKRTFSKNTGCFLVADFLHVVSGCAGRGNIVPVCFELDYYEFR